MIRLAKSRLGLVLALIGDLFLYAGDQRPPEVPSTDLRAALSAQAGVTDDWLSLDGVVGTAVGTDGQGRAVLRVYLTAAGVAALPATVDGVPVRPEVTGAFQALGDPPGGGSEARSDDSGEVDPKQNFPRPVPIGVSTGHTDITAGTIGARVTDLAGVYALSNNHVYANNNSGRKGDNLLQPGVADGGRDPDDRVGTLHDFEPIAFCGRLTCPANRIDAAIAATTPDDLDAATPDGGYGAPRSSTAEAELNMKVQKYGRTTGHTKGVVTGINATIDVNYRTGRARFQGQVVISGRGFSAGGDSGSLIVTDGFMMNDRRPVGLLFAGTSTTTVANPIDLVLERFGVTIDGG